MPTLRIHFDSADIARTRVASDINLPWELVLSLSVMQNRSLPSPYHSWQTDARGRLAAGAATVQMLTTLVGPSGEFPDFLTPTPGDSDARLSFGDLMEKVAATPKALLNSDLATVFRDRPAPTWVQDLAAGRPGPMHDLTDALMDYEQRTLAPHRRDIDEVVHADRALRMRHLLDGGVERMLCNLPAPIRWHSPVLETEYVRDRDLYLRGRGLTLIPSYFCVDQPLALIDPELPPVLVYHAAGVHHPSGDPHGLEVLLGRTRARALSCLQVPCSTSELAIRLDTSIGTASKHATALRQAGLLTSTRHGAIVLHALTSIGEALLARASAVSTANRPGFG